MSLDRQQHIEESLRKAFNINGLENRLSKDDFEKYKDCKKNIDFQKGELIFDDGENSKGVYFIKKGTAKLSKSGAYGKDQILRFIKEGDMIGYRSILCGESFKAKAEAMTDMETFFIPSDFFIHLLETDSQISYAMLQKIAFELGESSNTITFLAQKTVREKLAEILIILEERLGTDLDGFINISLTREEIANLIGTATESAIRLISEFKHDNLILVEGRNIKILDHSKLAKLACR